MKKVLIFLSLIILSCLFVLTNNLSSVKAEGEEEGYSIDIKEENNLATWKYDWDVVNIGSANTNFDTGHIRMENINNTTSNYCLYETNKFNSFRLDMYANLNLLSPSDFGIEGNDWCNLYLTFFIDYEDAKAVDNVAQAACPWTLNKGWLSVCFERIGGESHIQLLINETFVGAGGYRYFLNSGENGTGCVVSSIDWCDNQYHWFSVEVESYSDGRRDTQKGTKMTIYVDGVEQTSYKQCNKYYSNKTLEDVIVPFDTAQGYLGFWASSSFDASKNTENTGVAVDITKLQITSYDEVGVENKESAVPYTRCAKPKVNLNANTSFSPEASYEPEEDIEIKLDQLFEYDGDSKLTYTATCNGETIGQIRNGYFVWCPTEGGVYTISITATDGEVTTTNDIRLRVNNPSTPDTTTAKKTTTVAKTEDNTTKDSSTTIFGFDLGCNSSVIVSLVTIVPILSVAFILRKKKDNE